jgi:hypothetical protein
MHRLLRLWPQVQDAAAGRAVTGTSSWTRRSTPTSRPTGGRRGSPLLDEELARPGSYDDEVRPERPCACADGGSCSSWIERPWRRRPSGELPGWPRRRHLRWWSRRSSGWASTGPLRSQRSLTGLTSDRWRVATSSAVTASSSGRGRRCACTCPWWAAGRRRCHGARHAASVRDHFPAEASALEAAAPGGTAVRPGTPRPRRRPSRALQEIGHAEMARRTWAVATAHLAAGMAGGRVAGTRAAAQLAPAVAVGVTGTRRVVLDVLTGILACQRGDLSVARRAADSAHTQLAGRVEGVWPSIRAWGGWLDAEIAVARDDAGSLRETSYALWRVTGLPIASDIAWRPLLVAARVGGRPGRLDIRPTGGASVPPRRATQDPSTMERCARSRGAASLGEAGSGLGRPVPGRGRPVPGLAHAETGPRSPTGGQSWAMRTTRLGAACARPSARSPGGQASPPRCSLGRSRWGERLRAQPTARGRRGRRTPKTVSICGAGRGPRVQRPQGARADRQGDRGAALLAEGASNDEISRAAVHLAEDRQRPRLTHPRQAGCRSRTEAAATAHRLAV